jgi:hypothetical protein
MNFWQRFVNRRPIRLRGPLFAAALAALALASLSLPAGASTAGKIVIRGASSGSHLRVTTGRHALFVRGFMAKRGLQGCRFTRGRTRAVCPLRGRDALEIVMGPSDDKVEILHKLSLPLTTYLGRGEDKLIGNGERDTCYPQGTKRNRCIGGPGRDICITGPRNSDCVGGAGNDYCRHGTGSDGCWGGPGRDVCVMGPGQDGCHGEGGNDRLYGGPDPDQLYGGRGRDYCNGGRGRGRSHGCELGPGH